MSNYWNIPGVPHKGWNLIDVVDICENGSFNSEVNYETCMMCGRERIRFVHILEHDDLEEEFRVGCICAIKMTDDYDTPKRLENNLRNKASRRSNWLDKQWKFSKNGNQYLKKDGHHLLIYRDKSSKKYKCAIDDKWGKMKFDKLQQAKLAIFRVIEILKENEEW